MTNTMKFITASLLDTGHLTSLIEKIETLQFVRSSILTTIIINLISINFKLIRLDCQEDKPGNF